MDMTAAVIAEWYSMSEKEQVLMISKNITKVKKAYADEIQEEKDALVNETWISIAKALENLDRTNKRRAEKGLGPITLVSVVYRAAKCALKRAGYAEAKHGQATHREITDADGNTVSELELVAGPADTAGDAETALLLEQFKATRDERDCMILDGKLQQMTHREIAAECKITPPAVQHRLNKMREAFRDMTAE